MRKKRVTIVIVTFNSEKYIKECLRSILSSDTQDMDLKITIVDNQSVDSSVSIVKSLTKIDSRINLIEGAKNEGFARAINKGLLSSVHSDYYLLLNPDTVVNRQSIKNLIRCAIEQHAGIVGGSTYDEDGVENGSYFRFPTILVGIFDFTNVRKLFRNEHWHNYFYYKDISHKTSCFPVDVVTGGFMLLKSNTTKKIGLLDERFFMYLEDVDYCLRAKKAGIKTFHTNDSKIVHYAGRSSDNKDRVRHSSWLWSRKLYYLKNFGILENLLIQPIYLLDDLFILTKLFFES